jgi:hypothetical protein
MSGEIDFEGALRFRGTFVRWDGTELVVLAPSAAPPGARLDANVCGEASGVRFKMKAIRCRRVDAGGFEIGMRVLDLPRGAREELESLARTTT